MQPKVGLDELLVQSIPEIMRRWELRALEEVPSTHGHRSLILRNSLPQLIQSLGILLSRRGRTDVQIGLDAADLMRSSKEHGRSRANIPAYVLSQVIKEYVILREVIIQVLEQVVKHRRGIMSLADRELITSVIEEAIGVAATEFSLALSEVQDQFMLSIAHDLKSPMAAIKMGAEIISTDPRSEVSVPLADRMHAAVERMSEMLEELHDTSRLKSGHGLSIPLSECDLSGIVSDAVFDLRLVFGNCFDIRSGGPVVGSWNPQYLRRLVENLLNNAAKYRQPGSRVTITLSDRGQSALLQVQNLGEPISEADQLQLFNPMRRAKPAGVGHGWGLGLPFVKGIADAFGGTIRVESNQAQGTLFTVNLPLRNPASALPKAS